MGPYFLLLKHFNLFRVDPVEEEAGLDVSHHGGPAYHTDDVDHDKIDTLKAKRDSNV